MKPLFIVGTGRDVGKTTMSMGLLHLCRKKGLRVGYVKPLGQRFATHDGKLLHADALLVASRFGADVEQVDISVPLPSGRVEHEIKTPGTTDMLEKILAAHNRLAAANDLVIVEGMGHVAMGSCIGVSAAEVCRSLNAHAVLVSGGGIGRAIDEISLCATFLQARGADLSGVIVNKVWPEKYARIKRATTQGLRNLGITSYGTVPFEETLSAPTMRQIHQHVGGEVIGGQEHLDHRVRHTIIAAMQSHHMLHYVSESTLVITPGDRSDNILAALRAHLLGGNRKLAVSGLILTGDFRPEPKLMDKINDFHLPIIAVKEDTFTTANRIINKTYKITPDDHERIEWAICLVSEYVDVDAILAATVGS